MLETGVVGIGYSSPGPTRQVTADAWALPSWPVRSASMQEFPHGRAVIHGGPGWLSEPGGPFG
jgi:hypothetical protein